MPPIGCVWAVVVGLSPPVPAVFRMCRNRRCVVSIRSAALGSGIAGVRRGVDRGRGGIRAGATIVAGVMGVKDRCGILGLGSGTCGRNVSVCSSATLMFTWWLGVHGNLP